MLRDLFLYLLGGVTFLPLCVLVFLAYEQLEGESGDASDDNKPLSSQPPLTPQSQQAAKTLLTQQQAREAERKSASSGSRDHTTVLASWVIVKNTFRTLPRKSDVCFHRNGNRRAPSKRDAVGYDEFDDEAPESDGTRSQRSYMSYAYRAMRGGLGADSPVAKGDGVTPMPGADSGQTQDERGVYYAILKPPMLYIYNDDDMTKLDAECSSMCSPDRYRRAGAMAACHHRRRSLALILVDRPATEIRPNGWDTFPGSLSSLVQAWASSVVCSS